MNPWLGIAGMVITGVFGWLDGNKLIVRRLFRWMTRPKVKSKAKAMTRRNK